MAQLERLVTVPSEAPKSLSSNSDMPSLEDLSDSELVAPRQIGVSLVFVQPPFPRRSLILVFCKIYRFLQTVALIGMIVRLLRWLRFIRVRIKSKSYQLLEPDLELPNFQDLIYHCCMICCSSCC